MLVYSKTPKYLLAPFAVLCKTSSFVHIELILTGELNQVSSVQRMTGISGLIFGDKQLW